MYLFVMSIPTTAKLIGSRALTIPFENISIIRDFEGYGGKFNCPT